MTVYKAPGFDNRNAVDACISGETKVVQGTYEFDGTVLAADDEVQLFKFPADHVPVDFILATDALGGGVTLNIGFVDGASATPGNEFASATNVSAATFARMAAIGPLEVAATAAEQIIGAKVNSVGSGNASGTLHFQLWYRHARYGT